MRPKKPARLPTVLNQDEVARLLDAVPPAHALLARLLYGTGMRFSECLRLRVKDVDFVRREIVIREGKGAKDRVTMLPQSLVEPLQAQLRRARVLFFTSMTGPMAARCLFATCPGAQISECRGYLAVVLVFPADGVSVDPRSGIERRHHVHEKACSGR